MENANQNKPAFNNGGNTQQTGERKRHRRGGRRHGKGTNASGQNNQNNQNGQKQQNQNAQGGQNAQYNKPVQSKVQAAPAVVIDENEDAGLELISRRAPAQKYANFDEYMKAHEEE